jgi:curved DNA-binding protein CbpA
MTSFVKLVPYDAMTKAYRAAAMTYHPDRSGGDMEKMTQLNALWERIKKEVYNQ